MVMLPEARQPKVQAIIALALADTGIRSPEEANELAQAAFHEPSHVDLQILFLAIWYGMLASADPAPIEQMQVLESAMSALVTEDTPPEIRATVKLVQGWAIAIFFGNYRRVFELVDSAISAVPKTSPLYDKFAAMAAMVFLAHGMGTRARPILRETTLTDFDEKGITIVKLTDCAHTGKFGEAPQLIEQIDRFPDHKHMRGLHAVYKKSRTLISLMGEAGLEIPPTATTKEDEEESSWVNSTRALISRKPVEALFWAKLYAGKVRPNYRESIDFLEHVLVRAELAMGNARAAKRLLVQLREQGTEMYIDDLYFARAERLLGNHTAAARHFAKLKESISRYEAKGRLNFEIQMACELQPADLIELASSAPRSADTPSMTTHGSAPKPQKSAATIVSRSEPMKEVTRAIEKFSQFELPVLITGETGTGKELVSRAIHDRGPRQAEPFIPINCSAIPDTLIESELFGHASGAFTGARSAHTGIFRDAGSGTVFLDEIADISPRLQVALLRVLETNEVRPVGSSTTFRITCRVIAATNRELLDLVREGAFREDLYFRLQRLEIHIPPLRRRPEDIELLVRHFLNAEREGEEPAEPSPELTQWMERHPWRGNVRELRNTVERMRIMNSEKRYYDLDDLLRHDSPLLQEPPLLAAKEETESATQPSESKEVEVSRRDWRSEVTPEAVHAFLEHERVDLRRQKQILQMLEQTPKIKISEVAAFLGVSRSTAVRDLNALSRRGEIKKVSPTASSRSNYYTKCQPDD